MAPRPSPTRLTNVGPSGGVSYTLDRLVADGAISEISGNVAILKVIGWEGIRIVGLSAVVDQRAAG
jgi:hypothetical protein